MLYYLLYNERDRGKRMKIERGVGGRDVICIYLYILFICILDIFWKGIFKC